MILFSIGAEVIILITTSTTIATKTSLLINPDDIAKEPKIISNTPWVFIDTPTAQESILLSPPILAPICAPIILLIYAKVIHTKIRGRLKLYTKFTYKPIDTKKTGANTLVTN